ncbi:MAG: GNAT family N-acetyltransferase [Haloquadratum sp.]|jgi:Predicted acyltransferase|nr:GNAT family N-acetyltransferase [Haloferacaceae archaeon]MDR9444811.1 GNAT family N-acetyltransferase [Haloquadratum sp.]
MPPGPVTVGPITSAHDRRAAFAIRTAVFVDEQGVDPAAELDEHDDDPAVVHVLARAGPRPVGTGRLRPVDPTTAKIERVAVITTHRGRGIGRQIVESLEMQAPAGTTTLMLHSQCAVEGFYAAMGYERVSGVFREEGIDHVRMRRRLRGP